MQKDYLTLAFKSLKHRGLRSWLTMLGILIGIAAVISLISLGNALQLAVASQFGISATEIITIEAGGISGFGPPGSTVTNPLTQKDFEEVQRLSSIKRTIKRNIVNIKLEYNDNLIFTFITNVPDGEDRKFLYEQLDEEVVVGRFLKDSDSGKVFLGYNFYVDKVGLGKEIISGKKILINDKSFEVVGILDKKGSFIFDNSVFTNEKDMQRLFGKTDDIDIIVVQPKDKDEIEKTKEDIEKVLRKTRNVKEGEEDFVVSTPEASLATVNNIIGGVKIFIVIVASISIFIGAVGIVNTMTTSVLERIKEIGIMKAIGAKNKHIFLQFLIESGLLGLAGGIMGAIIGSIIGVLGTIGVSNFIGAELKPNIDFVLILFSLIGSFVVGGVAGIVPAMNAAKQNPVEALRK
jgi:putative ABC transport system permease protein